MHFLQDIKIQLAYILTNISTYDFEFSMILTCILLTRLSSLSLFLHWKSYTYCPANSQLVFILLCSLYLSGSYLFLDTSWWYYQLLIHMPCDTLCLHSRPMRKGQAYFSDLLQFCKHWQLEMYAAYMSVMVKGCFW